jgi:hypothetical protein
MSVTRRIFPEGFKREAVDRVASSGLSVEKVAVDPIASAVEMTPFPRGTRRSLASPTCWLSSREDIDEQGAMVFGRLGGSPSGRRHLVLRWGHTGVSDSPAGSGDARCCSRPSNCR